MNETSNTKWLKDAVFYEIYPQTFNDTNGDGIGDIQGIIKKLDYLEFLGINAIWLNPCFESPFIDAGYDVADYYKVAPRYGTNDELKELFDKAKEKGIKILLDLVPGHTSTECEWFEKSAKHAKSKYDDWFIWTTNTFTDTAGMKFVGGFNERNGQFLTNFFYCQPALNFGFSNPDPKYPWQVLPDAPGPMAVKKEIKDIISYWLDMGASGFRVDMAFSLVKKSGNTKINLDAEKGTCEFWKDIRKMLDEKHPEAVLISEWFNPKQSIPSGFHSDFIDHKFISSLRNVLKIGSNKTSDDPSRYGEMTDSIEELFLEFNQTIKETDNLGYISLFSGNHDMSRVMQDGITEKQIELYFAILLTLPGVPFIYYGDEIGMRFIDGLPSVEGGYNRCGSRTPMQWNDDKNAGFSSADSKNLYLPIDSDENRPNVTSQEKNKDSLLNKTKQLIKLRKSQISLGADKSFKLLQTTNPTKIVAFSRGENLICLFNCSDEEQEVNIDISENKKYNILYNSDDNKMENKEQKIKFSLKSYSYMIIKKESLD